MLFLEESKTSDWTRIRERVRKEVSDFHAICRADGWLTRDAEANVFCTPSRSCGRSMCDVSDKHYEMGENILMWGGFRFVSLRGVVPISLRMVRSNQQIGRRHVSRL